MEKFDLPKPRLQPDSRLHPQALSRQQRAAGNIMSKVVESFQGDDVRRFADV